MRNLDSRAVRGRNPMRDWHKYVCPLKAARNFIVLFTAKYLPFVGLKNALYRLIGIKIGFDSAVALCAMFDVFFPELITIGNNCVIGYNVTILTHEFLVDEWRKGRVVIGDNVLLGANSLVLAGVSIGSGAQVGAGSVVTRDVPAGEFFAGVPAKRVEKATQR